MNSNQKMKRKVIKLGQGGNVISLPKSWIDKKGIKTGDEIDISEVNEDLLVSSTSRKKQEIELILNEKNKNDIKAILTHLYRMGYDSIKLTEIDNQNLKEIEEIVSTLLLGFEITKSGTTECLIENVSEPAENKYESLLGKILIIIAETHKIINENFKKEEFKDIVEIEKMKNQSDKLVLFCRRVLTKEIYRKNRVTQWELLTFLMHIQHTYYYLYQYISNSKTKTDKKIISLFIDLGNYLSLFNEAYSKKDINRIHEINSLKSKFQFGECLKAIEESKGKNAVILSEIKEIYRLIQISTSPILSEVLKEKYSSNNHIF